VRQGDFSRRAFLGGAALAPAALRAADKNDAARVPDRVTVFLEDGTSDLAPSGTRWLGHDLVVSTEPGEGGLKVAIRAPQSAVLRVRLRWRAPARPGWRYLGDHWERSYGDLEWRALAGERVMPWYFWPPMGRPRAAGA